MPQASLLGSNYTRNLCGSAGPTGKIARYSSSVHIPTIQTGVQSAAPELQVLSSERCMTGIDPNDMCELEQLVSQQIQAFKDGETMDDHDIFEYHLRHFRIMAIYREMNRKYDEANARMADELS